MKLTSKLSDQEKVIEFLNKSDHPLKEVMEAVREIILSAHEEITEHIKWNAPSFCFQGEDREGDSPLFRDTTGLLEWVTSDRANVKLFSLQDVKAKEDLLRKAVNQWSTMTSG